MTCVQLAFCRGASRFGEMLLSHIMNRLTNKNKMNMRFLNYYCPLNFETQV